jgi:hypothetical protein
MQLRPTAVDPLAPQVMTPRRGALPLAPELGVDDAALTTRATLTGRMRTLRAIPGQPIVLIVDANMAAIGTENSRACMHFLMRMLHTQLQRQVHLPEPNRPRVPLVVDEAHYIADGENVVDQIATHRAAGLEVAFGLQYFAQLGSGSTHEEKIRKGVVNLLQSRFLFRMGDAGDAEEATRIGMAVYATMIRDDPDSRARLRVTPEQALNFPNFTASPPGSRVAGASPALSARPTVGREPPISGRDGTSSACSSRSARIRRNSAPRRHGASENQ